MLEDLANTDVEWISAKDALLQATERGHDPVAFKAAIAEYLRDELLTATAKAVWVSTEVNLTKAWKSHHSADDVERDITVPVRYWRSDKRATTDRPRWRWPYNQFFYTVSLNPVKLRMMTGVKFRIQDLKKLRPDIFGPAKRSTSGRKHDVSARDAGWLEIVRLATEGRLSYTIFKTGTDLQNELEERLQNADGTLRLGKTQVSEISRQVVLILKSAHER